ncbi:hypothetical protein [Anaerophaga thermohalophila]|uniref:hypothetical protein n=1 Tax=Anaerophaga thermohalophila TaxID=177400 RepID=UPI0002DE2F72|nr:hypothetical protein [Anaerophaga thermohalophila]
MKTIYFLISSLFVSLCVQAQETKVPLIRPLLTFETGVIGNSMSNITSEVENYTGTKKSLDASLRMGINAGIFIGERHKLALSYNSSINAKHESLIKADYYSTGFWYQYKVLKNNPLFIQIGFSETIANLYVRDKVASPIVNDGTLNEYLNDNSSYTVAQFEQWTDGLHLAISYNFLENSLLSISGQLGYLWNFNKESWQYMHNNFDRLGNTNLPKDNLNGLFLKVNMEFDFLKYFNTDGE